MGPTSRRLGEDGVGSRKVPVLFLPREEFLRDGVLGSTVRENPTESERVLCSTRS